MRTRETCTILTETDFQGVRMYLSLPPSSTPKHYPFHHLLRYLLGEIPTQTHHTKSLPNFCTPSVRPIPAQEHSQSDLSNEVTGRQQGQGGRL